MSLICAALLATVASLPAWAADPVEDLLLGNPESAQAEAILLIEPETAVHSATIPAVSPQDDETDWAAAPNQALQLSRVDSGDHKRAATSPVNAVPEPSALLLALAALVYFMLFGRRRRMV